MFVAALACTISNGGRTRNPRDVEGANCVDSTRITSAPHSARCIVEYGPAHTTVKSMTRRPSSGRRPVVGVSVGVGSGFERTTGARRAGAALSTSSVCAPRSGACRRSGIGPSSRCSVKW